VRTIAVATTLAVAALFAACSSSSSGGDAGPDAALIDVMLPTGPESDATVVDASDEEAEISPVDTCDEGQLAFATTMACGQCAAQKCAKYLQACTNCITCQQQLGNGCSACGSMCFGGPGPGPVMMTLDGGP
jgi:hypothetical protein